VAPVGIWIARARFVGWKADRERATTLLRHPDLASPNFNRVKTLLELTAGMRPADNRQVFDAVPNTNASSPRGRCFFAQIQCELGCMLGDHDGAIRFLARAVDAGLFDLQWLEHCPLLKPLRVDLRFHALRKIVATRAAQVHDVLRADRA
jgi:hypothetical protein